MDPTNYAPKNSIALAILGSILFAMLLVAFSNLVFAPVRPKVPGYALPSGGGESAAAPATTAAPAEEPLPALLTKANAAKGQQDAKVCTTCHNFDKGAGAKVGPPLWGVVGRAMASIPGFSYSDSMVGMHSDWTYEALNKMIANPKSEVSGTKMAFPGEKDPQKRADILAYLQTLSDSPVPFPK